MERETRESTLPAWKRIRLTMEDGSTYMVSAATVTLIGGARPVAVLGNGLNTVTFPLQAGTGVRVDNGRGR